MTTKVNEVVTDALEDLIVQADEAPIEQSEARAAIRGLNDMMQDWDARGISLGYTVVDDMGDEMTVAAGAIRGIKSNLAIELAPKYNVPITLDMLRKAKDGFMTCIDISVEMSSSFYPDTLPRGSGNDYPDWSDQTFYPELESTILTETGGSIALESDTEEES